MGGDQRLPVLQLELFLGSLDLLKPKILPRSVNAVFAIEQRLFAEWASIMVRMLLPVPPLGHMHRFQHMVQLRLDVFRFLLVLLVVLRINIRKLD